MIERFSYIYIRANFISRIKKTN